MVAIISVVIGVRLDPFPAGVEQGPFDDRQILACDHDIEIADAAPCAGGEICRDIGGALHQHDLARIAGQRPARAIGFPQSLPARQFVHLYRVPQHRAHSIRDRHICEPVGQRTDQGFGARDADQFRPLAAIKRPDAGRFPQSAEEDVRILVHGSSLHRLSISFSACSID